MPAPSDSFPAGGPWPPKDLHHLAEVSSTVVGPVGRPADDTSPPEAGQRKLSDPPPSVVAMTASPNPQPSFDDLGTALPVVTFVVVDLETTGSTADDTVTEIGAVKVRGGEILGEFGTLVNPRRHIPPLISVLTGITDTMVAEAPTLPQALPAFMQFAEGAVLVAHNASFDTGFLRRACLELGYAWPNPAVVDTVTLARSVLLRDEVPNCRLGTLARHFRSPVTPNHRALQDARATVDVLHALIERIGNLGVTTLEDLLEFTRQVSPQRRAKRSWASDLPTEPGVYCFVADWPETQGVRREVLYVGKSRNLRTRVRTYFTASEKRSRMDEMVRVATGVETTVCRTPLEADVLELRLIAAHSPRYNRRSKFPEKQSWLKLTREPFPRLSLVARVADDGATYFGPFGRRASAEASMLAILDAFPLRQCTARLSLKGGGTPCALAGLGRCSSPCDLTISPDAYADVADAVRRACTHDVRPVLIAARGRLASLVQQQRYEEAGILTGRLETYARAALRRQRILSLAGCPQIVAACRAELGWEIHVIRHGRLAAAALARPGEVPQAVARDAVLVAEQVQPSVGGLPSATIEETERIADWLERPGVRLIEIEGDWAWPLHIGLSEGDLARHAAGGQDTTMPP